GFSHAAEVRSPQFGPAIHGLFAALSVAIVMLASLGAIPSLGARWIAILTIVFIGSAIGASGGFFRAMGVRSGLTSAGFIIVASALPPLFVYAFARSASLLWLLLAPAFVLAFLKPFLARYLPHTVLLNEVTLEESAVMSSDLLRVAHLSDLHLCDDPAMEGALDSDRVRNAAETALRWALDRADVVLLTGDLTDRGSAAEWRILAELLDKLGSDRSRIHFVPGNHDLAITLNQYSETDGHFILEHEEQHRHFCTSILRSCPPGWRVRTNNGDFALAEVFSQAAGYIARYEENPPSLGNPLEALKTRRLLARARGSDDYLFDTNLAELVPPIRVPEALKHATLEQAQGSLWPSPDHYLFMHLVRALYPMVFHKDDRWISIGLNSNTAMANSILTGAFGQLGSDQLDRLDTLLGDAGRRCKIISLHHHIGQPPLPELTGLLSHRAMKTLQLTDAKALHDVLARHDNVMVFHGHEHIGYHAAGRNVTVVSAPSVAYGHRGGGANCFIYHIDLGGTQTGQRIRIADKTTLTAM
ncbi:MAG TPA: metallophosphoesterase, partial [Nitrospirota bacterium]